MKAIGILSSLTLLGLSSMHVCAQKKPHIILIMTDQHRFDCVGSAGNPYIQTPNIDAISADGVSFSNAYVSVPSSTPARASLLTGMSPWNTGMLGYSPKTAEKYTHTMPQMLRDAGYFTFGIGKMHWTPQRNLHGFHGALLDESGRVESADFVSDYRQWFAMEAPGENPDKTNIDWNAHAGKVYQLDERLHPTVWTANEAIRLLNNYKQDNPLFLKISFARPHSPYDPPQRIFDQYKNATVIPPYIGDWCAEFANRPMTETAPFGDFGIDHAIESRRYYYASVTFIDEQIGRIVTALKQKGIYDNCLLVFISDHGDMLGDHHHWRKTYAYEGSAHIPFIVKPPLNYEGLKKGEKLSAVVELRDVLPTFLDIAGVEKPNTVDGVSVLNLVKDANTKWRPYIDLEHSTVYESDNYWAGLTNGKIKYIYRFVTGQEQLFDLETDPHELTNLVNSKKYTKTLSLWRSYLVNHLSIRGDRYVKNGQLQRIEKGIVHSPNYDKF